MHGTIPVPAADDALALFIERAKSRGYRDKILDAFDRADKLKIAFVGETIIDEYRYVKPLAKPSKEFILATVETEQPESFQGGVVAAALHGEWPEVTVVTRSDNPIRKTRFVDKDFTRKLFEVYSENKVEPTGKFDCDLIAAVRECDVVVALDFGHGLLGATQRHILESAKFLAVNAQTNAGNYGFNPVTKYQKAAYVCVDEPEARIAVGLKDDRFDRVLFELSERIECDIFVITRGRYGATSMWTGEFERDIPPLAVGGIDTIGAGDAFLAVTAPLVAAGLELEAAAFVGNIAGAIKVGIVGHRAHVTRQEIVEKVEALLV